VFRFTVVRQSKGVSLSGNPRVSHSHEFRPTFWKPRSSICCREHLSFRSFAQEDSADRQESMSASWLTCRSICRRSTRRHVKSRDRTDPRKPSSNLSQSALLPTLFNNCTADLRTGRPTEVGPQKKLANRPAIVLYCQHDYFIGEFKRRSW